MRIFESNDYIPLAIALKKRSGGGQLNFVSSQTELVIKSPNKWQKESRVKVFVGTKNGRSVTPSLIV